MTYRRLSLTDIVVDIQRGVRTRTAEKAWQVADVEGQWERTNWAKKIAAKKRKTTMSDFDRFKQMVQRKKK